MERALAGLGSRFSQKLSASWPAVGYGNNLEISGGTVSNETSFSASFPKTVYLHFSCSSGFRKLCCRR